MKKIWFLPMLASSTMLTGCASLLQDSATYDPEVSRAGNIGKIFEIEIDDQEVAQGIELGNDSSVMLDSLSGQVVCKLRGVLVVFLERQVLGSH